MSESMTTEHSVTLGALAKALASAQGKIAGAARSAQNGHLKNKYSTLADVWDACRGPLSAANLAVVQLLEPHGEKGVCVVTMLLHGESGEWIKSRMFMPAAKADAHSMGSATTYARRYSLAAMVGVTPDDDDGQGAMGMPTKTEPRKLESVSSFADPAAAEKMATYAAEIEKQPTTKDITAVYARIAADASLAQDAKDFLRSKCTARRNVIEGKTVAA